MHTSAVLSPLDAAFDLFFEAGPKSHHACDRGVRVFSKLAAAAKAQSSFASEATNMTLNALSEAGSWESINLPRGCAVATFTELDQSNLSDGY